jgi:hypothetical protein
MFHKNAPSNRHVRYISTTFSQLPEMINASNRAVVAAAKSNRNRYKIPVFPHVKKFIAKNCDISSAIKTEEYTTLGRLVTRALLDRRTGEENNDQYRDKLTTYITISLTKEQAELSPRLNRLMRINIDLDRVFKDHLLTYIYALKETGIPPFTACRMFLELYKIDEKEYSLDAAYRFWQRAKGGNSIFAEAEYSKH